MTLVILTAGDLSVGSVLALCGAFAAAMLDSELSIFLTVPAVLLAGALLGGVSGVIIAKGRAGFHCHLSHHDLVAWRDILVFTDGRPISTGFSDAS